MKKLKSILPVALALIIIMAALVLLSSCGRKDLSSYMEDVDNSASFLFENSLNNEVRSVVVCGDDIPLKTAVNFPDYLEAADGIDQNESWYYRIRCNCRDILSNGKEFVILIGEYWISVDDDLFISRDRQQFRQYLEHLDDIYEFYIMFNNKYGLEAR